MPAEVVSREAETIAGARPLEGAMRGLAVLVGLLLVGAGFAFGGWRGALTGLVGGVGVGSGLAILAGKRGTGVEESRGTLRRLQRVGGLLAAVGCLLGVLHGGWRSGWAWGIGGYVCGIVPVAVVDVMFGLRHGAKRETGARPGQTD